MSRTYEFSVPGVVCAACVAPIENAVRQCKELTVESVDVAILDKLATITVADTALPEAEVRKILRETIEDIGYECLDVGKECTSPELIRQVEPVLTHPLGDVVIETSAAVQKALSPSLTPRSKKLASPKKTIRNHVIKGLVGIITGSVMLGLCISGIGIPVAVMYCLAAASSALTLYLGKETYYEAGKKLIKSKTLTMDSLFAVSTLMAIGVSLASLFFPWLPMMYDAALLIFGFRHIGKAIEESAKDKILQDLTFRSRTPLEVELKNPSGNFKKAPVNELKPGDLIIVRKGQIIPVDGECLEENTSIYNTIITGRTLPQPVMKNELLRAGSRVPEDVEAITLRVTASEKNSYLALLDIRLKEAQKEKAPLETAAKKILQYFVPTVLALAAVSAIAIGVLFSPLTAIQVAATILVSACPCTFGLIIPLAIKIGIVKAAADGVRFKSGKTLEAAQQVDTVVFDLNGTLTTGVLRVTSGLARTPPTNLSNEMLDYLAALERQASHPFAKAIRLYIYGTRNRPLDLDLKVAELDRSQHSGLSAKINGETFSVGNKSMMLALGFSEAEIKNAEISAHEAEHVIYFARGNQLQGCILLSDPLRKDAKAVVQELQRQGKQVHICTGADKETAERYGKKLGIQHLASDCLAESEKTEANTKTRYIRELTQQGRKVAMVGDAGNDAPAIETSHFGIAVESESSDEMTQQKAGAVINKVNNKLSLRPIVTAFAVANQTVSNIKQNLGISLSYNVLSACAIGGLLVGLGFVLNPAIGAVLMILQTVFILANAQRFKKQKLPFANDPILNAKEKPEWESTDNQVRRRFPYPQPDFKPTKDAPLAYEEKTNTKEFLACTTKENLQPERLSRSLSDSQIVRRLV